MFFRRVPHRHVRQTQIHEHGLMSFGKHGVNRMAVRRAFFIGRENGSRGWQRFCAVGQKECDIVRIKGQSDCYPEKRDEKVMKKQENGSFGGKKGCGFMQIYPVIDVQETGRQLRTECERRQVTPKELQEFLGLAALQSIYNWFQGRTLPSLDNFYALSCYLGIRMEELVVPKRRAREVPVREAARAMERRMVAYLGFCLQAERPD